MKKTNRIEKSPSISAFLMGVIIFFLGITFLIFGYARPYFQTKELGVVFLFFIGPLYGGGYMLYFQLFPRLFIVSKVIIFVFLGILFLNIL